MLSFYSYFQNLQSRTQDPSKLSICRVFLKNILILLWHMKRNRDHHFKRIPFKKVFVAIEGLF